MSRYPIALVHDYLTQRGGAERVLLALGRTFPAAPIFTSVYRAKSTYPEFRHADIRTTGLQRLAFIRSHHRLGFPAYARVFSRIEVPAAVTICSTSGWAHGVQVAGHKILYVHNTARWIYQPDDYFAGHPLYSLCAPPLTARLRDWDRSAGQSADVILANSRVVANRIEQFWKRDATVVYPPHGATPSGPCEPSEGVEPGYFLVVARLLAYKRVDAVLEAMRLVPSHQLLVVGGGPEAERLKKIASKNVTFLGEVSDERLRWLYANCLSVVSAASEDFGLVPLEAMAYGRPSTVLRAGGFRETVSEGDTGVFFDSVEPGNIALALQETARVRWDSDHLRAHAAAYSEEEFAAKIISVATSP